MEQPNLGKRIAGLRKAKGLTQEELAMKCNVSARTLQRIEAGVVVPRAYTVRAIFKALECEPFDSLEKNRTIGLYPVMRRYFEQAYHFFIDLFNLKTNTMKKISVLSGMALAIGFGLFVLCSESNAQKYIRSDGRGITYLFSRELHTNMYISNMKDTADYKFGKYLIQEYKKQIFLDGKFIERVDEGDTVILHKGTIFKKANITVRKWSYSMSSMNGKNIIYILPQMPLNYSRNYDEYETYLINHSEIRESRNKIFLNGIYQGDAFANDTVILRKNGTLTIKNTKHE